MSLDDDIRSTIGLIELERGRPFSTTVVRLYAWAEMRGGVTDPNHLPTDEEVAEWPIHAGLADWLADRLDDLGVAINRRRAIKRMFGR